MGDKVVGRFLSLPNNHHYHHRPMHQWSTAVPTTYRSIKFRNRFGNHTWNDEILLELHAWFAFSFSRAMDSGAKWKILSLNNGASNLSIKSSTPENGRRTSERSRSPNQRSPTVASEIQSPPSPPLLVISDHTFKKCVKEVPSPTTWLKEQPMKMPSMSLVTCSASNGKEWPS